MIDKFIPDLWAPEIKERLSKASWFITTFYDTVERGWRERLFSFPWRPLVKKKLVPKKLIPEKTG